MKGKHKHKATGGANEPEEDVKDSPKDRSAPNNIGSEAEQMKKGGRTKRASGGGLKNKPKREGFGPEKHGTETDVAGVQPNKHAGRKPRKSGGKTTSDESPFTSARMGKDAPGRSLMKGEYGMGET